MNVILPLCWIALGGYYAVDYFTLYYTDADDEKYGGPEFRGQANRALLCDGHFHRRGESLC